MRREAGCNVRCEAPIRANVRIYARDVPFSINPHRCVMPAHSGKLFPRKLLLHRREIDRLAGKVREKGYTLVPLSLYEKKGRVKAEIALVHGKQQWDKREDAKKRESDREIDRAMASRRR